MIALLLSAGMAFLVALAGTPVLIRWLRAHGIGQQIRDDGPEGHVTKAGTPTMGGVMIVGAAFLGYGFGHLRRATVFTRSGMLVLFAVMASGLVGLVDDWLKVSRQQSLGLTKRGKLAGQLAVAIAFALLAHNWAKASTMLSFTRYSSPGIDLGTVGWVIVAVLLIVGAANAVNLTDGLDGLAIGPS